VELAKGWRSCGDPLDDIICLATYKDGQLQLEPVVVTHWLTSLLKSLYIGQKYSYNFFCLLTCIFTKKYLMKKIQQFNCVFLMVFTFSGA
jgi:hypothetical protein